MLGSEALLRDVERLASEATESSREEVTRLVRRVLASWQAGHDLDTSSSGTNADRLLAEVSLPDRCQTPC